MDFDLLDDWREKFSSNGIEIHKVFDDDAFVVAEDFDWSVTQYKYQALNHIFNILNEEDVFVFLDCDTIVVNPLDELFLEASRSLVLYNTRHSFNHKGRKTIRENYEVLYGSGNPIHYGGELIAGTKGKLEDFLKACRKVIFEMTLHIGELKNVADEHVTSIAIEKYLFGSVTSASPYIFRFWTGDKYIVSTNCYYDELSIWHLPGEKFSGFKQIYQYFSKYGKLPSKRELYFIMRMPNAKPPFFKKTQTRLFALLNHNG